MCEIVRPTSLAMSLNVGTGGNPLRSFLVVGTRFADGVTGTGTVLGPWACIAGVRIRKKVRRNQDLKGYPNMCGLNYRRLFFRSKAHKRFNNRCVRLECGLRRTIKKLE